VDYRASTRQPDTPPAAKQDRICGLSRRTFFVALAILAFAAVAAVAIGLGLGLGLKKDMAGYVAPPLLFIGHSNAPPLIFQHHDHNVGTIDTRIHIRNL
jgi:hypothetical protein